MNFGLATNSQMFTFEELFSDDVEIVSGGSGGGSFIYGPFYFPSNVPMDLSIYSNPINTGYPAGYPVGYPVWSGAFG